MKLNLNYANICYYLFWGIIITGFLTIVYDLQQFVIGILFGLLLALDIPNFIISFFKEDKNN